MVAVKPNTGLGPCLQKSAGVIWKGDGRDKTNISAQIMLGARMEGAEAGVNAGCSQALLGKRVAEAWVWWNNRG